jgi:6-phosphogluconolactonase
MRADIEVIADLGELAERCAAQVVQAARTAQSEKRVFTFCASGGNTPRAVYRRLAQVDMARQIDWQRVQLYFGDERCVAPTSPDSNFHMLEESLLAHVPIPSANVKRIAGEVEPHEAAREYAERLQRALGVNDDGLPRTGFDLVFLGVGTDAHTASLFPGSSIETTEWVSARQQPGTKQWRVTLTEPVFNAARQVMFLVTGADKAATLATVLEAPRDPVTFPAQRIEPLGALRYWLDSAAAARL